MLDYSGDWGAKGLCMRWQSYWEERNLEAIVRNIRMPQKTLLRFLWYEDEDEDDEVQWLDDLNAHFGR